MSIERHLIGAMPPPPESVPVPRLVHGNAVDPGSERRLAAETVNRPEDAKEDVLGEVERLVAVTKQVHGQLYDHALMFGDEFGAGRFVFRDAPLDEGRFPNAQLRPARDP